MVFIHNVSTLPSLSSLVSQYDSDITLVSGSIESVYSTFFENITFQNQHDKRNILYRVDFESFNVRDDFFESLKYHFGDRFETEELQDNLNFKINIFQN